MKKLLLVFFVFALMSSTYAMCPRMASCRGYQNCRRMAECEYWNECPMIANGCYIASGSNCYNPECPIK